MKEIFEELKVLLLSHPSRRQILSTLGAISTVIGLCYLAVFLKLGQPTDGWASLTALFIAIPGWVSVCRHKPLSPRLGALWCKVRGHDVEWRANPDPECCPGDILCHTCDLIHWCRYYDGR